MQEIIITKNIQADLADRVDRTGLTGYVIMGATGALFVLSHDEFFNKSDWAVGMPCVATYDKLNGLLAVECFHDRVVFA